jgi:hypothetical protein
LNTRNHDLDNGEFADESREISSAYARESREQPTEHIDEVILAASRKAAGSRPGFACVPFSTSWQGPVSIAAVLVLSVGLVITLQQYSGEGGPVDKPATLYDSDAGVTESITASSSGSITSEMLAESPATGPAMPETQINAGPDTTRVISQQSEPVSDTSIVQTMGEEVEFLQEDIAGLQRNRQELERERLLLKREIARVEARQKVLREEIYASVTIEGTRAQMSWLTHIRNLRVNGADALARSNLRDFNAEYPDYPRYLLEDLLTPEFVYRVLEGNPDAQ